MKLLFMILFLLQANLAHSHCGRAFSEFFPQVQAKILSSQSFKTFSREGSSSLSSEELKEASMQASLLQFQFIMAGVDISQKTLDELTEISKFMVKNPRQYSDFLESAMNQFIREDFESLKNSKETVAIFHALPLNDKAYVNVFGRSPSYDTSTKISKELIQEISGNKILIKQHDDGDALIDDISNFKGTPIIIAHNDEGVIKLTGFEQTLPLSTVQDACIKTSKRCIVLSCKASNHVGSDKIIANDCVINPSTALAISADVAKYVESHDYKNHDEKTSLKKIESIIKAQEKNILGHCSIAPVLIAGGIVTTGSYIMFGD
ncbi:hypothetical protein [Thalassomonas haliotis]|uniref:Uncharacterized protein n=1 Tax=Thalassomonas haliotis TaxID=485448 RepID=A0ABY7VBY5_9GAMM|nr:hypothetical protein [Thalassomonas haliotis]WDE11041.1 hypothetical protein H3N35_22830 [Thalassomonas haliotis]